MDRNKSFDKDYVLLDEMYSDPFFPDDLVKKVEDSINTVIELLETGEQSKDHIQKALDIMTREINDLEDDFLDSNSEIETLARESIALSVAYVLSWFRINIDIEDAIRFRTW